MIKTYVLFRLDRQSWTRQKTALNRGLSARERRLMDWGSLGVHMTAMVVFICAIGFVSDTFALPESVTALLDTISTLDY